MTETMYQCIINVCLNFHFSQPQIIEWNMSKTYALWQADQIKLEKKKRHQKSSPFFVISILVSQKHAVVHGIANLSVSSLSS